MWVGIGTAVLGAGTTLYGANKQAKAISSANASNQEAVDKQNQSDWNNYLLQRGIYTGGSATTGSIPTNATAVNTRMPLWASVNVATNKPRWQKVTNRALPGTMGSSQFTT